MRAVKISSFFFSVVLEDAVAGRVTSLFLLFFC